MRTSPAMMLHLLEPFVPLFSRPVWPYVQTLLAGAILAPGKRTISAALRVMGLGQTEHFQRYHRVLNRAVWSGREASRVQTLSVLEGLDPARKGILLRFLYESGLTYRDKPVVSLEAANLSDAILSLARLYKAYLFRANLNSANLSDAMLIDANLSNATLMDANLSGADLSGAKGWNDKQLAAAESLRGAIMPDGQQYEDWIKRKGRREAEQRNEPPR